MSTNRTLKAVILAAGSKSITDDGLPVFLQDLGDKKIIDYVVANALQVVSPEALFIVTGYRKEAVQAHLGQDLNYVSQKHPLGTGDAVQTLRPHLKDFDGDLLILYGDTPLFSTTSIRGLINRHRLCRANLTLLTVMADKPYPYGRVIRDHANHIMDIIEDKQASSSVKEIRELNVGAYIFSAQEIWSALDDLAPSPKDGEYRLTDTIHHLIHRGLLVESYQVYDQDEIQGINTREDLEQAEFILRKRYFQRRKLDDLNTVQFGTGGWRAVIGEGFTLFNVRRLCQSLANEITRRGVERHGVLLGYDRRFLSDKAAEAAAEIFAGNNIRTILLKEASPTPLIEFSTTKVGAAYGLAFTASHNAPEWNGLKVFHGSGALLMPQETDLIESETNSIVQNDLVKIPLDTALSAGIVKYADFTNDYVDKVESFIDMGLVRQAGLNIIVDPMYGVGRLTLGIILNDTRCRVTFINERHNPLFGGRSPTPDLNALRVLQAHVRDGNYALGLAMDGDADRIAVIDEKGDYVEINDILLLLYWYLHEVKEQRGGVVRNLATTHLLDRLAGIYGESCFETPVGFKWIASEMVKHKALLGGESSGGLTIRGHILGKDGILAAAMIVEMIARTGKPVTELLDGVWAITGRAFTLEKNITATADMRIIVPQRVEGLIAGNETPGAIRSVRQDDGTKIVFDDGSWALLRFSGTEPILRIFAEAESPDKAQALVDWLNQCAR